ncbi:hypothetical protein [Phyllobacterium lublinensis]|uniref:hypothetical protein n=1 Tax=Phyllobacterium lublinensis TaxID=2875708 RepID=UPI001CCE4683|nr:hypothetical protein [Phyllobacterium sp. 2063]MBZ9654316.1 hypothetical protein [Phyllobacterium sp. 2063]
MATTFLEPDKLRSKRSKPIIDKSPTPDVEVAPAPVTNTGGVKIRTLPNSVYPDDPVLPEPDAKVIKADAKHKTLVGSASKISLKARWRISRARDPQELQRRRCDPL